jgi:hypothetical protein
MLLPLGLTLSTLTLALAGRFDLFRSEHAWFRRAAAIPCQTQA